MKHLVLFIILTFASLGSYACEINAPGLSSQAKQNLIIECEKAKLTQPQQPSSVTVEDVDKWADISQKFAGAIGIAAKEIGVSVNEFIKTPAGMITVALVIWMSIGESLIILGAMGFIWVVIFLGLRRLWTNGHETVDRSFLMITWKTQVRKYITYDDATDGLVGISVILLAIGILGTILAIGNAF